MKASESVSWVLPACHGPMGHLMKSTVCVAEDRAICEPAVKLLIVSLCAESPETTINLFYPPAGPEFAAWLSKYPQARLNSDCLMGGLGWNVKPKVIMHLLDKGFDEVIWIDSDVLVTGNLRSLFAGLDEKTFVATEHTLAEERDDSHSRRALLWGFLAGRVLPFALNSGVIRVTRDHYHLMERWWDLLQSDDYQRYQKLDWRQRPVHMLGDQDVMTALLTSREFSDIPIRILYRGGHIIQFDGIWGYGVPERVINLFGHGPIFIHASASKPWAARWDSKGLREYIKMVYLDLSPYTISALRYRGELGSDNSWMLPHYRLSTVLRLAGFSSTPLVGLPIALFGHVARFGRWLRGLPRMGLLSPHSDMPRPFNTRSHIE